jgi:hypothetical protein
MPTRHRCGVAEKLDSARQRASYPLAEDQIAKPKEKILIFACGLGNFARGSQFQKIP